MGLHNHAIKLLWVIALAFVSCMDGEKNSNGTITLNEEGNQTIAAMEKNNTQTEAIPQLKYFYNTDSRNGMVTDRYPFPATWQQHNSGDFAFTGPNGIKVYGESARFFSYSNDPTTLQQFQMVGFNVKYPLTMNEAIDEFLVSHANTLNRKMVKKYPIPQLKEFYKNFDSMLFKVEQNQKQFDATAIEWVDPDGTRWLTVFNYQIEQGYNKVHWGFSASAIGAPAAIFEKAKQDYLNGLLNRQINPQWVNTMNQQDQYAIQKSNEAHARRQAEFKRGMDERQKQWEANQEGIANLQKQWEDNQESISRRNEMVSDAILGKVNIIDPASGDKSKIDNTNVRYWVNSQNKYIGTDTSYEDPNKNSYLNGETWREFKIDDYKQ